MRSRLAARLLTGPLAFLLAGAIDVALLWTRYAAQRARARAARRPMH
jgi:hypothetical protein